MSTVKNKPASPTVRLVRESAWIYDHFRNPRALQPDSIMPSFRFTDGEFRAMSAYLAGLKTPPPAAAPAETYQALCQRCHGEKGDGKGPIAWYLDPYPRDLTKASFMNGKPVEALAESIRTSWRLNQDLDAGTNPPEIQRILARITDHTAAAKLLGAGGGGYLLILAKDAEAAQRIRRTLRDDPPNAKARFVDLGLSETGFEVTRS